MADAAPLVTTPDAPVPRSGGAEWIRGAGGVRLRAALFAPDGAPRGSIVLSGGRTEPIEKYYEVIQDFLDRGFAVLAHDWRGQGLSARELPDRLKGHARGYRAYLDDFQALLATFEPRLPRPWIAVGHSMGGCLTLLAMAHGERRFAGAILSAPMLGLQTGAASKRRARLAARFNSLFGRAGRAVPGQTSRASDDGFEGNVLTHDRARFARARGLLAAEPQLALGGPTWGWLDFAFRAAAYLARPGRLGRVTVPVVIVSAGDDRLVDNAAQAAAARHLPQGKLLEIPGAYHEVLMEIDPLRNAFLRAFDTLAARLAPRAAEPREGRDPAARPPPAGATAAKPKSAGANSDGSSAKAAPKPATKARKPSAKTSGTGRKPTAGKPGTN